MTLKSYSGETNIYRVLFYAFISFNPPSNLIFFPYNANKEQYDLATYSDLETYVAQGDRAVT